MSNNIFFANAKINLGLNIINKRPDGFHNIETIFYPIQLVDILEYMPISLSNTFTYTESGIKTDCSQDNNLCIRAYRLAQQTIKLPSLKFHLHKQIPVGAGLGGGSSDAANFFKQLIMNFSEIYSDYFAASQVKKLGSDCAFFIHNTPLFAFEKGDVFEEISLSLKNYCLVLVYPNLHVNTSSAYKFVTPSVPKYNLKEIISNPIQEWKNLLTNDFELSVFQQFPEIKAVKETLYNKGALFASMSGSGSSVYGIFEKETNANTWFPENYFVWQETMK